MRTESSAYGETAASLDKKCRAQPLRRDIGRHVVVRTWMMPMPSFASTTFVSALSTETSAGSVTSTVLLSTVNSSGKKHFFAEGSIYATHWHPRANASKFGPLGRQGLVMGDDFG